MTKAQIKAECEVQLSSLKNTSYELATALKNDNERLQKEVERLKGLIEKMFKGGYYNEWTEHQWQQFKTENNL